MSETVTILLLFSLDKLIRLQYHNLLSIKHGKESKFAAFIVYTSKKPRTFKQFSFRGLSPWQAPWRDQVIC